LDIKRNSAPERKKDIYIQVKSDKKESNNFIDFLNSNYEYLGSFVIKQISELNKVFSNKDDFSNLKKEFIKELYILNKNFTMQIFSKKFNINKIYENNFSNFFHEKF